MYDWSNLTRMAPMYKRMYPEGTRIELECMGDDPRPIAPGTRGTVRMVDDIGTVHCDFDNGRRLGLVPGEDSFRKLTARELEEEQGRKAPLVDQIHDAAFRTTASRNTESSPEKVKSPEH